jgi:murein DD-endopeptidase MepM/ murein hydrolase activator NlpD
MPKFDPIGYIKAGSRQRGVDPRAVLAVARQEGLGGGIGDQGTSFGPFQLHYGGAYPAHAPRGQQASQAWAWSPAGLSYALDRIAGVSKGLQGRNAISAIVNRFERPANPAAEIGKALAAYGGANQGGFTSPISYETAGTLRNTHVTQLNPHKYSDFAQSLLSSMSPGQPMSVEGMLGAIMQLRRAQAKQSTYADQHSGTSAPHFEFSSLRSQQLSPNQLVAPGAGGWFRPGGKIIATPQDHSKRAIGNWQSDNALDIGAPVGTPVYAPVSGKLGNTGYLPGHDASDTGTFAGQRVNLFGGGNGFYFAHMTKLGPGIKAGATVKKGQLLGYTGTANGVNHLHFGVERGNPGDYYGG